MAGMQVFTASGSFTPVSGRTYKIIAIGGGKGGGYYSQSPQSTYLGERGRINTRIWTAPNTTAIAVTVGTGGGLTGSGNSYGGVNGSASSFGSILTATGGTNQYAYANASVTNVEVAELYKLVDGFIGVEPAGYVSTRPGAGAGGVGSYGGNAGVVIITWDV